MHSITFSLVQLIRFSEDNNGMVFIDNKYATVPVLKESARNVGSDYRLELEKQNSICSLHLKSKVI